MHLLESDASTNSSRSCMESPTPEYQTKSNSVSMIQTGSRLETKLPSRIGDQTMSGIHCSSSRLFTEASLKPNDKILNRSHYNKVEHAPKKTPGTQKEQPNHTTFYGKDNNRKSKKKSPTTKQYPVVNGYFSNHTYDLHKKQHVPSKEVKEKHRNGIITRVITSENQRHSSIKDKSNASDEELRDSRQNFSNNNNNSNRSSDRTPPHKRSISIKLNTDTTSKRPTCTNHNYIENGDSVDPYNGSNILKRMYESFGKAVNTDSAIPNSHPTKSFENHNLKSELHKEKIPAYYAPDTSPPSRKRKQELLAKHENENAARSKATRSQEEIHPSNITPPTKLQPLHPTPIRLSEFNHNGLQRSPGNRSQDIYQERSSIQSVSHTEDELGNNISQSQHPSNNYKCNYKSAREGNVDQIGKSKTPPKRKQATVQSESKIAKLDTVEDLATVVRQGEAMYRTENMPGKNDWSKNKLMSPSHSIESLLSIGRNNSMHGFSETANRVEKQPSYVRNISETLHDSHGRRSPNGELGELRRRRSTDRAPDGHKNGVETKKRTHTARYEGSVRKDSRESPYSDTNVNHRRRRISSNEQELPQTDRFKADGKDVRDTLLSENEKSLRQNDHHVFPGQIPGPFPNQCMLDPNTLALLQANLLSSMQPPNLLTDPNMVIPTTATPYAAGYPTNPLFQYLANPYLLRGLMANGLPGAQYNQALTQQLLAQQRTILLHSLQSPQAMNPALNPFFYGGLPIAETNPITAALAAASMRANATVVPSYSPSAFSYPFAKEESERESVDSHPHARDEVTKSKAILDNNSHPGLVANRSAVKLYRNNHNDPMKKNVHPQNVNEKRRYSSEEISSSFKKTIPDERRKRSKEPLYPAALASTADAAFPYERSSSSQKSKKKSFKSIDRRSFHKDLESGERELKTSSELNETSLNEDTAKTSSVKEGDESILDDSEEQQLSSSSSSRPSSYKNLTRERRLVANARERTRVHTISSAFEELRQQIPSYSCNQKLSKLAILRIACSYIQSLSVLAGRDTDNTFQDSVDQCTRVLQAESRARSRRKSNKAQIDWEVENYERIPSMPEEPGPRLSNTEITLDSESSSCGRSQKSDRTTGEISPHEMNEISPSDHRSPGEEVDYRRDEINTRHSADYQYNEYAENPEIDTDNRDRLEEKSYSETVDGRHDGDNNEFICKNKNSETNTLSIAVEDMNDLINVED